MTIQRKFHEEIIELFREIKSTDSKDILDKYRGIEPALVNQIQKSWPLEADDLQKSLKRFPYSLGIGT